MTLAEELARPVCPLPMQGRRIELLDPPFRLPFDGRLSAEEARMASEGEYERFPVGWEA